MPGRWGGFSNQLAALAWLVPPWTAANDPTSLALLSALVFKGLGH